MKLAEDKIPAESERERVVCLEEREEDRREEREYTPDERFQHGSVRPKNSHGF